MVSGSIAKLSVRALSRKLVVILLLICQISFGELIDRVIANVNGEPVLESELRLARDFFGIKDEKELYEVLIEKHLIAEFIKGKGMTIPEDYLERVVKDLAEGNNKTVSELYDELYREGFTPEDLKHLLRLEIYSTLLFKEYLLQRVEVSELEIELERLRKGEVKYRKELQLLVVEKEKKDEVLKLISKYGSDIEKVSKELGKSPEKIVVERGELVESLDEEVWRVKEGELAVGEDEEHIYLAKVVRTIRTYSGRSEEEIRNELLQKKLATLREEVLEKIRKEFFVEKLI